MSVDWLNAKEIAAALGFDAKTITTWANDRVIPAEVKEGRIYRFDLEKVKAALAERAKSAK